MNEFEILQTVLKVSALAVNSHAIDEQKEYTKILLTLCDQLKKETAPAVTGTASREKENFNSPVLYTGRKGIVK